METVRPNDQTVRLLLRSAVAVVVHDLAVEVQVEVGAEFVSGMIAWGVRMERLFC